MEGIFDPVVDKVLQLIQKQLEASVGNCKALMVVGGFSQSPYLMAKIRDRFMGWVPGIVNPADHGAAVLKGAALLALHQHKKGVSQRGTSGSGNDDEAEWDEDSVSV